MQDRRDVSIAPGRARVESSICRCARRAWPGATTDGVALRNPSRCARRAWPGATA